MSYTRIDDGILTHPKMQEAEEQCPVYAWVLWSKALVYVNQHKLDGKVTRKIAVRLVGAKHADAAIDALTSTGLWDVIETGWYFHDFETHSATKEKRAEKAKQNAENQRNYRERQRLEKEAAEAANGREGKRPVSAYGEERKQPESDNENAGDSALFPRARPHARTPLLSTPTPLRSSPPHAVPETAEEGSETSTDDPSDRELFRTYAHGLSQALGGSVSPVKSDANIHALSCVWGEFGQPAGQTPSEFLADLGVRIGDYVADVRRRKQPPAFEAGYSPKRFLDWLRCTRDGADPFPRAPVALDEVGRGGSHGALASAPSAPLPVPPRPDEIASPDDPNRIRFFELVGGGKT